MILGYSTIGARAYERGVSLEWKKLWHAELPPLHHALRHFVKIASVARP